MNVPLYATLANARCVGNKRLQYFTVVSAISYTATRREPRILRQSRLRPTSLMSWRCCSSDAVLDSLVFVVDNFYCSAGQRRWPRLNAASLGVDAYGFSVSPSDSNNRLCGILDVVAYCSSVPLSVMDVDCSHHTLLLRLPVALDRPDIRSFSVRIRLWCQLDLAVLRSSLSSSALCKPSPWTTDADAAARLYSGVIIIHLAVSYQLRELPAVVRRLTRGLTPNVGQPSVSSIGLQRAVLAAIRSSGDLSVAADTAQSAWRAQPRAYRQLWPRRCTFKVQGGRCRHRSASHLVDGRSPSWP